jgi:hypothetical protein
LLMSLTDVVLSALLRALPTVDESSHNNEIATAERPEASSSANLPVVVRTKTHAKLSSICETNSSRQSEQQQTEKTPTWSEIQKGEKGKEIHHEALANNETAQQSAEGSSSEANDLLKLRGRATSSINTVTTQRAEISKSSEGEISAVPTLGEKDPVHSTPDQSQTVTIGDQSAALKKQSQKISETEKQELSLPQEITVAGQQANNDLSKDKEPKEGHSISLPSDSNPSKHINGQQASSSSVVQNTTHGTTDMFVPIILEVALHHPDAETVEAGVESHNGHVDPWFSVFGGHYAIKQAHLRLEVVDQRKVEQQRKQIVEERQRKHEEEKRKRAQEAAIRREAELKKLLEEERQKALEEARLRQEELEWENDSEWTENIIIDVPSDMTCDSEDEFTLEELEAESETENRQAHMQIETETKMETPEAEGSTSDLDDDKKKMDKQKKKLLKKEQNKQKKEKKAKGETR